MTIVFVVIGALAVFAIAAAFVGTEAFRLGHTPTTAIFDLDEAVIVVGEGLDDEVASGLTYEELRQLIVFSLDYFRENGVSARPGEELPLPDDGPPVVLADDVAVASVLGRADDAEVDVTDECVLGVLDGLLAHLVAIGAVGPVVAGPDDPEHTSGN